MARFFRWRPAIAACLGVFLASCEVPEPIKPANLIELAGLATDAPCDVTYVEGRRLAGAYLRSVKTAPGSEVFFVTGRRVREVVPGNLIFDEGRIGLVRFSQIGFLKGTRKMQAAPRDGFGPPGTMPNVFDLSYRSDGIDYGGVAVIGPSPTGAEFPTTGRASFGGRVDLVLTRTPADGATTRTRATGTFRSLVGYGSGRGAFEIAGLKVIEGPPLEFTGLTWSRLGLCGSRMTSSGQGEVRVIRRDGRRALPFAKGRAPVPLRAKFESSHFAAKSRPAPPTGHGGVFIIESDEGTISGVFLTPQD